MNFFGNLPLTAYTESGAKKVVVVVSRWPHMVHLPATLGQRFAPSICKIAEIDFSN